MTIGNHNEKMGAQSKMSTGACVEQSILTSGVDLVAEPVATELLDLQGLL